MNSFLYSSVHFCTPDDSLLVQDILSFTYKIKSLFVKPPSDTLFRYHRQFFFYNFRVLLQTNYGSKIVFINNESRSTPL
jgi:hypothetical protein